MEEKESFEAYITKEIQKSGFPLEAFSSIILDKFGWGITPHLLFFNSAKNCYNEIDIHASKESSRKGFKEVTETLIIECKKQEKKPWVFFEQQEPNTDFRALQIALDSDEQPFERDFKKHYYHGKKPCAYHFPCFVKSGKPDVILDTVNHVIDSMAFCRNLISRINEEYKLARVQEVFYPVIVLSGKLFSAKILTNGKIEITKSNHLQLKVSRAVEEPKLLELTEDQTCFNFTKEYLIDIVRKDWFESFLKYFP